MTSILTAALVASTMGWGGYALPVRQSGPPQPSHPSPKEHRAFKKKKKARRQARASRRRNR